LGAIYPNGGLADGFKYFSCSSLFEEDFHFEQYFSKGLKPPTSGEWDRESSGKNSALCEL